MSNDPRNYTDYGGGDHETAYQGCVWLLVAGEALERVPSILPAGIAQGL